MKKRVRDVTEYFVGGPVKFVSEAHFVLRHKDIRHCMILLRHLIHGVIYGEPLPVIQHLQEITTRINWCVSWAALRSSR